MIRIAIVLFAMFGVYSLLGRFLPSAAQSFYIVAGFGITYIMVACLGTGLLALRVTK